jgi:rod shape determining protein RodA
VRNVSLKIFIIALLICVVGVLSIYSSTYRKEGELWQNIYQRQILWIVIGIVIFQLFSNLNYRRIWDLTNVLYWVMVVLLFLVFVLGIVRLGAQRWLRFAWFNFQPSEAAKLIMVIFLARYFSAKSVDDIALKAGSFGLFRGLVLPFIFVAVPVCFIIEQPDLGSGAMVFLIFLGMLFLSKIRIRYAFMLLAILAFAAPLVWNYMKDYQKERIQVFLNPNVDPLGAGYTIIQAKIAIGSGGFFGKGWLAGTQSQLRFLPESHTDFVFSTFTEEWGFLGGLVLIFLYYLLIRQAIMIAEKTSDHFGRLLSLGIALMLGMQIAVNIAMNIGLAPVVGLPLPLMSYGGSSVIVTFIALGILVNINKTRAVF